MVKVECLKSGLHLQDDKDDIFVAEVFDVGYMCNKNANLAEKKGAVRILGDADYLNRSVSKYNTKVMTPNI